METNVANSISALSVVFGVAVFHLGASSEVIKSTLNIENPSKTLEKAREQLRGDIVRVITVNSLPNLVMLLAIAFVMLPQFVKHISHYKLELWDFDFMITLYQIIGVIVFFYLLMSAKNTIFLLGKWCRLKWA